MKAHRVLVRRAHSPLFSLLHFIQLFSSHLISTSLLHNLSDPPLFNKASSKRSLIVPARRDYLIAPLHLCAKRKALCFRLRVPLLSTSVQALPFRGRCYTATFSDLVGSGFGGFPASNPTGLQLCGSNQQNRPLITARIFGNFTRSSNLRHSADKRDLRFFYADAPRAPRLCNLPHEQ